ncbi:MAG: peptidylprolyl isomerase [Planctomycetota bacterium]
MRQSALPGIRFYRAPIIALYLFTFVSSLCASELKPVAPTEILELPRDSVYLYVNGEPIRGGDLVDPIIKRFYRQHRAALLEQIAVDAELDARGLTVSDADIEKGLDAFCVIFQRENKLPSKPSIDQIIGENQTYESMRRSARLMMGVIKLLKREERLPFGADPSSPDALDAYTKRAKELMALARVVENEKDLPDGVGLRVSGVELSKRELAIRILNQMPPADAVRALKTASENRARLIIFETEMLKHGLTITPADQDAVFEKILRRIEDKQYLEEGKGMDVFKKYLADSGRTLEEYKLGDDFFMTCFIQKLIDADGEPDDAALRAFFDEHPDRFGAGDPLLETIFIEVIDPNGSPFYQFKTGLLAVDRFYERSRRDAFNRSLQRARAAAVLAKTNFRKAVDEFSDDIASGMNGGEVGYIGIADEPSAPFTPDVYRYAREDLKDGETSDPVECIYGYHILRITRRREPVFSDMQRAIHVAWWNWKRETIERELWLNADFRGVLAPAR